MSSSSGGVSGSGVGGVSWISPQVDSSPVEKAVDEFIACCQRVVDAHDEDPDHNSPMTNGIIEKGTGIVDKAMTLLQSLLTEEAYLTVMEDPTVIAAVNVIKMDPKEFKRAAEEFIACCQTIVDAHTADPCRTKASTHDAIEKGADIAEEKIDELKRLLTEKAYNELMAHPTVVGAVNIIAPEGDY
jgi:hypothetical protein